jgi:hypothetical protein
MRSDADPPEKERPGDAIRRAKQGSGKIPKLRPAYAEISSCSNSLALSLSRRHGIPPERPPYPPKKAL